MMGMLSSLLRYATKSNCLSMAPLFPAMSAVSHGVVDFNCFRHTRFGVQGNIQGKGGLEFRGETVARPY